MYICVIKFLIWLRYWSCFRHSNESGYCSLYIQFYKLLWLWFYVGFFLNLGYYYNDVEYRHNHSRQHISIRKNLCFTVNMTASPAEAPSVTSGLRVSVQRAKPVLPIRFLYEELPKVCVFSAHKMFTTFCTLFPNRISRFKILAMPCVYVFCSLLTRAQGSPAFRVAWK